MADLFLFGLFDVPSQIQIHDTTSAGGAIPPRPNRATVAPEGGTDG